VKQYQIGNTKHKTHFPTFVTTSFGFVFIIIFPFLPTLDFELNIWNSTRPLRPHTRRITLFTKLLFHTTMPHIDNVNATCLSSSSPAAGDPADDLPLLHLGRRSFGPS